MSSLRRNALALLVKKTNCGPHNTDLKIHTHTPNLSWKHSNRSIYNLNTDLRLDNFDDGPYCVQNLKVFLLNISSNAKIHLSQVVSISEVKSSKPGSQKRTWSAIRVSWAEIFGRVLTVCIVSVLGLVGF